MAQPTLIGIRIVTWAKNFSYKWSCPLSLNVLSIRQLTEKNSYSE